MGSEMCIRDRFFGEVNIDGQSGEMSVVLRDMEGVAVFEKKLQPV